ncbi:MAG: 4-(cytidine 5'-diphospho)-2-C-methyl-D-erythritol kinase [Cytophagaceae bacterium]
MIAFPNAKINLGLYITEKRQDGYHNIETIFYPIPWSDILEIIPSENTTFNSSGINIPGDTSSNLCIKAYQLLKDKYKLPPVHIYLHKIVPIGAGLGGGSSDASFTLSSLNKLFDLNLNNSELEEYASKLGSDCAFFIENKATYAYGKGDQFKALTNFSLKGYYILLIYPPIAISTQEAYNGITPKKSDSNIIDVLNSPIQSWKENLNNDFEVSLFPKYPVLKKIKEDLYQSGAIYASMSGSGSTMFGIYNYDPDEVLPQFSPYQCFSSEL